MKQSSKNIIVGIVAALLLFIVVSFINFIDKDITLTFDESRSGLLAQASAWRPIIGYWREGLIGVPVLTIETLLEEMGYRPGVVDTKFDADTKEAVNRFTQDEGLYVNPGKRGIVRKNVRKKMNDYIRQFFYGIDITRFSKEEKE